MYDSMIIMAIITCIITSLIMITSNIHGVITVSTISTIIVNLIITIRCIIVGPIMIIFTSMHRTYVTINIISGGLLMPSILRVGVSCSARRSFARSAAGPPSVLPASGQRRGYARLVQMMKYVVS